MTRYLGAKNQVQHLFSPVLPGLLAMVLLASSIASADVLQMGVDASRTGVIDDAGPKLDEVAWTIQLPGSVSRNVPLIIGDHAYVTTSNLLHPGDLDQNAIWRISLADGSATAIIALDEARSGQLGGENGGERILAGRIAFPHAAVTDGERFYVAGPERVVAYDRVSGKEQWDWAYPDLTVEQELVYCTPPALTGRLLVLGCTAFGEPPGDLGDEGDQLAQLATFIVALDLEAGEDVWMWVRDPAIEALNEDTPANPTCTLLPGGGPCNLMYRAPMIIGVSVFSATVVAGIVNVLEESSGIEYKAIVALDLDGDGELKWIKQTTQEQIDQTSQDPSPRREGFIQFSITATGDDANGYLAFGDLFNVNPATGVPRDVFDLEPRGEQTPEVATSFALTEDRLFFTIARTIIAVDRYDFANDHWDKTLPPRSKGAWGYEPLTYADGVVYGRVTDGFQPKNVTDAPAAVSAENTSHFQAYDALTGDLLWSHTLVADFAPRALPLHSYTVAAGLLLVAGQEGRVVAIGRTDASLRPEVAWPSRYPAVGEEITINAGDTPASTWAGAPASTAPSGFRVDWGDGTITDWQTEPAFSHTYGKAGNHQAILYVRNDAGQQSAEAFTFDVGGTPPRELNFLQEAFLPKNYDLTFGVLGILLALSGGTIAVTNRRLRRGRLQGEGHEERQLAYRRVLAREIEHGAAPEELAERLKPLRGVLGITDREHARLEAEARALRVAAAGGARLLVPGERFLERYEVERKLGAGGAGLTYLCRDIRLDRMVVLKVLRTAGDEATAAALEEARAIAAIAHDRVVTLHDVEQLGDDVYLVLEYVDGRSLAERLADGPLEPEAMRRLAEDLLSALEAVHRSALVHRDVKPANVLVTKDGSYKLGDFGLASAALDDETAVGFDGGAGTARYMAPEQARGERVDARSDLFGAALTLYEAITGTPYYERRAKESLMDVHMRAAHGKGSIKGVPEGSTLRAFFDRALSHDAAGRFQDAAAMRAALLAALEGAEDEGGGS